jgi:hypothetical protein
VYVANVFIRLSTLNCTNYYPALSGSLPGLGQTLLRHHLLQIHNDIVQCWNFRDSDEVSGLVLGSTHLTVSLRMVKILRSDEFKQMMLYLVQDMGEGSHPNGPNTENSPTRWVLL